MFRVNSQQKRWPIPANMTRWNDDVLMLGQRRRRWANIKISLFQLVVFAGIMWWQWVMCWALAQQWPSIGWMCCVSWLQCPVTANTRHWTNVGLMLTQRLRRWVYIKPTLGQRLAFSGILYTCNSGGINTPWYIILLFVQSQHDGTVNPWN